MNHRVRIDRAARILITVLSAAGATRLAAQQADRPTPTVVGAATEANAPSTSWLGTRLPLEVPRLEPTVAASRALRSALFDGGDNHTFVFSTLALVLIGGLAFLLVVR